MAIHYDPKVKRFRDDSGRLVAKTKALRSSTARAGYRKATGYKLEAAPPKAKAKPRKSRASILKTPPWEQYGEIREFPDDGEWFPDSDDPDYYYDYDDLSDEWGHYDIEETDS